MDRFVGGVSLPPVSQEFIEQLQNAFPVPEIVPGTDKEDLMYRAGQAYVVDWIKKHVSLNASTGDPVKAQKATVRLGS
jgi:hypothetical protein